MEPISLAIGITIGIAIGIAGLVVFLWWVTSPDEKRVDITAP